MLLFYIDIVVCYWYYSNRVNNCCINCLMVNKCCQQQFSIYLKGVIKMIRSNEDIRQAIIGAGLKFWQIAYKLNLNDGNFSRKLRKELSEAERAKILAIIDEIKGSEKQ